MQTLPLHALGSRPFYTRMNTASFIGFAKLQIRVANFCRQLLCCLNRVCMRPFRMALVQGCGFRSQYETRRLREALLIVSHKCNCMVGT